MKSPSNQLDIKYGGDMEIFLIIVIPSSIWVYFDAKKIGVRKGLISGFFNMSPIAWMFSCILLWIVSFPVYLSHRSDFIKTAGNYQPDIKENKTQQSGLNTVAKFIGIGWTLVCAVFFVLALSDLSQVAPTTDNEFENAGFVLGATMGFGMWLVIWSVIAIPATITFFLTKKSEQLIVVNEIRKKPDKEDKKCPFCAESIKKDAIFCRFCSKNLQQAEPVPTTTMTLAPPDLKINWLEKGKECLKTGEFTEAVAAFTELIKEQEAEGYYQRAIAFSKLKDKNKMMADLKRASNLSHTRAAEILLKFNNAQTGASIPKITTPA